MTMRAAAMAVLLAACLAAPAATQQVTRQGASDAALDRRLSRLLREEPLVVTRDTLIAAGDTVARPVLVLGEVTIIVEGVLLDDLVLVQAGAFVRPGAVIRGDVVNLNGGVYRSQLAEVGGAIIDLPAARYEVVEGEGGGLVIVATGAQSRLQLDGIRGLQSPTYDRVNGLTVVAGATYWLPMIGTARPYVRGEAGWRTELGEPVYGAELGVEAGAYTVAGGYEHRSDTNDEWIRGDLMNSLNYLLSGKDYRDYHEVDRAWAGVSRRIGDEQRSLFAVVSARFEVEDARTLPGDEPWHILGDSTRVNPAIDDGRTTSVVGILELAWEGMETVADATLTFERAIDALDGAFTFSRVTLDGDWAAHALANHTLEIEAHLQAPLGRSSLPRQRWGFVGGSGTIQTAGFAEFYGDHVVFVETKYIIPLPQRLAVPFLGAPDFQLVHAAGMAWAQGEERDFRQEVGARVQFFSLYFRYMFEPSNPDNAELDIGLTWPFGGRHPWQRP
ncbi:MAG TPA: hypothetical protein VMM12_10890 [Longimicrobiales bacterium]|nr:hypothetical protein [Longimicrobiales bacterium]